MRQTPQPGAMDPGQARETKPPRASRKRSDRTHFTRAVFQLARTIFAEGTAPSDGELQRLSDLLTHLRPSDLGFTSPLCGTASSAADILYASIFDDAKLSIGVFFMRKGAVIPIHDHPGMSVIRFATPKTAAGSDVTLGDCNC